MDIFLLFENGRILSTVLAIEDRALPNQLRLDFLRRLFALGVIHVDVDPDNLAGCEAFLLKPDCGFGN